MAKQKTSSNKYHHKKKKKDIVIAKRLFETGERRLLRKNIVLSNTSAPAVPLPEMMLDICGREETEGTVFQIPDSVLDSLKALGAFKTGQHWPYFQRPSTLVRKGSVEIGKLISWINEEGIAEGEKRYARRIMDGTRGSGRSIVLAQAMNWAVQSNWVVISIPNGMPYAPSVAQSNFKFTEDLVLLLYSAGSRTRPHRIRIRSNMELVGSERVHRCAPGANIESQQRRPRTGLYLSFWAK